MAGTGLYLHRQNHVTPESKTMLAVISQQITIPAYLFANIIHCPSDCGHNSSSGSSSGNNIVNDTTDDTDNDNEFVCPSVADRIGDLWMLLLWPFYVVLCGLISGYIVAKLSNTPPSQIRACIAACAFPNSTGLAITLLSVIHKQFSSSTAELGKVVDPIPFLSVYLLLYPVLQWGLGGLLLAPTEDSEHNTNDNNDEYENSDNDEASPLLIQRNDVLPLTETLLSISHKVLQPPVTWSIIGLFIASFPSLRGILVNIHPQRGGQAPLQFVYDGIYTVC
jgi:hypothetical protein